MIVKPAEGLTVLDPSTARALPLEGISADAGDLHWNRLERDGDVTFGPDPDPEPAPATAPDAPTATDATDEDPRVSKGDNA